MKQKYNAPINTVFALLTDPKWLELRGLALGELSAEVDAKKSAQGVQILMTWRVRRELPSLVDYSQRVAGDRDIEIVLIAMGKQRQEVRAWAQAHGVPVANLYADPESKTAGLIGVRRNPETLIYDPEGHLAHQARGPMNWSDPQVHATVEGIKHGAGEHQH